MNQAEVRSLATELNKAHDGGDEPGVDSTRRPRIPVGKADRGARREIDRLFARRAANAHYLETFLQQDEHLTADQVEDALIDAIDARRSKKSTAPVEIEEAHVDAADVSQPQTSRRRVVAAVA